ncbi:MAG: hypothetical protein OEY79_03925, partial [Anaplasmataceae bacterium]|nr:hypothetical protein [Anaplasmataceae bacterium]
MPQQPAISRNQYRIAAHSLVATIAIGCIASIDPYATLTTIYGGTIGASIGITVGILKTIGHSVV